MVKQEVRADVVCSAYSLCSNIVLLLSLKVDKWNVETCILALNDTYVALAFLEALNEVSKEQVEGLLFTVHVEKVAAVNATEGIERFKSVVLRDHKLIKVHIFRTEKSHF